VATSKPEIGTEFATRKLAVEKEFYLTAEPQKLSAEARGKKPEEVLSKGGTCTIKEGAAGRRKKT